MSVLHLLGSRGDGGAETYFVDLVSALHGAGIEQTCAIGRHEGRARALAEAGVVARSFGFGGPIAKPTCCDARESSWDACSSRLLTVATRRSLASTSVLGRGLRRDSSSVSTYSRYPESVGIRPADV